MKIELLDRGDPKSRIPNAIWEAKVKAKPFCIYSYMCTKAQETGQCVMTYEDIGKPFKDISIPWVKLYLRQLIRRGLLKQEKIDKKTCRFTIIHLVEIIKRDKYKKGGEEDGT